MNNYDQQAREDFKASAKSVYFWLLASSCVYYLFPSKTSLLSDECFDKICKWLLDNYESCPKHSKLAHLVTKENLIAGSFYNIRDTEYPLWLVRMSCDLSDKL